MSEPRAIDVCGRCHEDLQLAATAAVSSTGEFALRDVMTYAERAQMMPTRRPAAGAACTWCGRAEEQVRKLLSSGDAHICNACVALCADILTAEFGDDWHT